MDSQRELADSRAALRCDEERHDRALGAHLAFWNEYLAGAPTVLALPADHQRPRQQGYPEQAQQFALSHELSVRLGELSFSA